MRKTLSALLLALCAHAALADEPPALPEPPLPPLQPSLTLAEPPDSHAPAASFVSRAIDGVQATLDRALEYLGIRYKWGGENPETGFDCSGFVRYVYNESLGLLLPRNARAMSQEGERVA
ncbi:MAG: C40 family peptidase, partial [Parvularculaceae bacterium]|nr:C40 family peptidase [Parvularculaceae bacterium]